MFVNVNLEMSQQVAVNLGINPHEHGGSSVTKASTALS